MNFDLNMLKPISAFTGAGFIWLADAATATPHGYWAALVKDVGLPTAMLGLAIYGLTSLSSKLSASEKARVEDQKEMLKNYREDSEKAAISRQALIAELRNQTNVIRSQKQD